MTVSTVATPVSYVGASNLDTYVYPWRILQAEDLAVWQTTAGVTSLLVLDTDYTVDGVLSYTGGNVTLLAGDLPTDDILVLFRDPSPVQDTSLANQSQYNAKVVEAAFDLLTMEVQAQGTELARTLRGPTYEDVLDALPSAADRANMLLGFDQSGAPALSASQAVVASGNFVVDTYVGGVDYTAGVTDELTLSQAPGTVDNLFVTFDGASQLTTTFSVVGTTLTFDAPIPDGVLAVQARQSGVLPLNAPANNSVGTDQLQAESVTAAKLADDAVIEDKILDGAVTEDKIDDGAVTLPKLGADVVSYLVPIGAVVMWGAAAAPTGWLILNGASLVRASYPDLFTVLGTTWGSADGTHFTLPDLRGRTPIGVGTGSGLTARALAATGGEESHVLITAELAAHTHTLGYVPAGGGGPAGLAETNGTSVNPSYATQSTGSNTAHNTMQPFAVINFIIKALP